MSEGMVSHAQNPGILRRARDFYATYCASSDGKNYQGLPCPEWESLTPAIRGHWYTVALRSLQLEAIRLQGEPREQGGSLGLEDTQPNDYVLGHLPGEAHALFVWQQYSGVQS